MNRKSLSEYVTSACPATIVPATTLQPKLRFSLTHSCVFLSVIHWHYQTAWNNVTKSFGPSMEISNTVMTSTDKRIDKYNQVPIKGHNQLYQNPTENLYGSEKNGSLVCHIQSSTTIPPTHDFLYDRYRFSAASTSTLRMVENGKKRPIRNFLIQNGIDVPLSVEKKTTSSRQRTRKTFPVDNHRLG